ncbi:MAG: hypothetical protein WCH39_07515, partial [Schlesneria sp.]
MDVSPPSSLERILSRRTLMRGHVPIATIWSFIAMLVLVVLLFDFCLFVGLLVDQGRVDLVLSPKEVTSFEELTGLKVTGAVHE